jgi:hypothetical protein
MSRDRRNHCCTYRTVEIYLLHVVRPIPLHSSWLAQPPALTNVSLCSNNKNVDVIDAQAVASLFRMKLRNDNQAQLLEFSGDCGEILCSAINCSSVKGVCFWSCRIDPVCLGWSLGASSLEDIEVVCWMESQRDGVMTDYIHVPYFLAETAKASTAAASRFFSPQWQTFSKGQVAASVSANSTYLGVPFQVTLIKLWQTASGIVDRSNGSAWYVPRSKPASHT